MTDTPRERTTESKDLAQCAESITPQIIQRADGSYAVHHADGTSTVHYPREKIAVDYVGRGMIVRIV